jgi:hypothetical protein
MNARESENCLAISRSSSASKSVVERQMSLIIVNPVHFLLRDNIKRHTRDNYMILLFYSKYKHPCINVIFLQDKHNINVVSVLKSGIEARLV